jgi:hypothetical protein
MLINLMAQREACGIFRHCCATQGKLPAAHHAILYQLGCSGQVLNGRAPSVFRGRSFVILSERTSWLRQTARAWQRKKEKASALKIPFRKGISQAAACALGRIFCADTRAYK